MVFLVRVTLGLFYAISFSDLFHHDISCHTVSAKCYRSGEDASGTASYKLYLEISSVLAEEPNRTCQVEQNGFSHPRGGRAALRVDDCNDA